MVRSRSETLLLAYTTHPDFAKLSLKEQGPYLLELSKHEIIRKKLEIEAAKTRRKNAAAKNRVARAEKKNFGVLS